MKYRLAQPATPPKFRNYWKPFPFRRPRVGIPPNGYTGADIAKAYGWPTGITAAVPVAWILELGGAPPTADAGAQWCDQNAVLTPTVNIIGTPAGDPGGADVEVALDGYSTVAAAIAYMFGRPAVINYVFVANSDSGMISGFNYILKTAKPGDFSPFSWGGPESGYAPSTVTTLNGIFQDMGSAGISMCGASGDNGPDDGTSSMVTDYPACSPFVICCGATTLTIGSNGLMVSQVPWNSGGGASGGGYSKLFPVPSWQKGIVPANATGRGCPDVVCNGDPATGYSVPNTAGPVGGTSASTPMIGSLCGALNALAMQAGKPPIGFFNPLFYANANPTCFSEVVTGSI
jgi:kumamolisin